MSSDHPSKRTGSSPSATVVTPNDKLQLHCWMLLGFLFLVLLLSYLNSLVLVADSWNDSLYSFGFIVPLFAIVLLWLRREEFTEVPTWQRWIGVGVLAFGIGMRLYGALNGMVTVDFVSFVPSLMGIFILVGGLRTLVWAGPAVAFLVFMFPLPGFLVNTILRPLQTLATKWSLFALQTLGVEAYREGNVIQLEDITPLNVADQCSGLRMLTVFSALAVALAIILTNRPWWERLLIVISAVPIALLVNAFRITVTGLLFKFGIDDELAHMFFHDIAGLVMMPLALGLLYLEYQVLSRLVVERSEAELSAANVIGRLGKPPGRAKSDR